MANIQDLINSLNASKAAFHDKAADLGLINPSDTPKLDVLATDFSAIVNRGSPDAEVTEGSTYTIQPGYYTGGTVTGVGGGGDYDLQAKEAEPTTAQFDVTPDAGYYGLSKVTVKPIPAQYKDVSAVTAAATDVLSGKAIVTSTGTVAGTMPNNGGVTKTLDAGTTSYTVPAGYHNGSGTVSIATEEKTVTPTGTSQNVVPSTGKVLSKVIVNPIPAQYANLDGYTLDLSKVLAGTQVYTNNAGTATLATGTMVNKGADDGTISGLTAATSTYTIPEGYHNGSGVVSLNDDIYNALNAI